MALRRELAESLSAVSALGVIAPPPLQIETPAFEGSLAALFKCVREAKIDLRLIPLSPVCEAYFEYLLAANLNNLDEAAVALLALSYLLERKAWALLPSLEPEPEIEEEMDALPPTAHEYAGAIDVLRVYREERSRLFFRSPEATPGGYEMPYSLESVAPADLARAFARLLARADPKPDAEVSNRPRRSLADQMRTVIGLLTTEWQNLETLIHGPFTREDAVYWFLSLLELVRLGQAGIRVEGEDVQFARSAR
jgi:chromatin segregation and condensation protein Rec8/ScpA/Scc1 (kleisin family)